MTRQEARRVALRKVRQWHNRNIMYIEMDNYTLFKALGGKLLYLKRVD